MFAEPKIGANVIMTKSRLGQYVHISDDAILEESELGDYSYTAGHNQIYYASIGKFVSIATYVRINPGNHPTYNRIAQHHFTYRASAYGLGEDDNEFFNWRRAHPVTVGNDVWMGHNAVIMPGVAAKKIGMRFDDALIEKIERSQWWNWDHATLKARMADFRDLDLFVEKYL